MTTIDLLALLRAEGCAVVETPGWRTRARPGAFTPVGVMNHHTANPAKGNTPSLNIVTNGRADLRGPLCNILIGRDAVCYLISAGRANDSGKGSASVLARIRDQHAVVGDAKDQGYPDDADGNPWFYDIEVENDGVGEPYSDEVINALIRCNAAILRGLDRNANCSLHHREWTKRKIDMSWRGGLRSGVTARLDARSSPPPPLPPTLSYEVDMNLNRVPVGVSPLDSTGHGFKDTGIAWTKVLGCWANGADVDPKRKPPYVVPHATAHDVSGQARVTVEGGLPNGSCLVFLTVAA